MYLTMPESSMVNSQKFLLQEIVYIVGITADTFETLVDLFENCRMAVFGY